MILKQPFYSAIQSFYKTNYSLNAVFKYRTGNLFFFFRCAKLELYFSLTELNTCCGLNFVFPKRYVTVLIPQYLRIWPYLKTGSLQRESSWNEVIRVSPNPMWSMSLPQGENWTLTCTQGKHHMPMKAEIKVMLLKLRNTKDCQQTSRN